MIDTNEVKVGKQDCGTYRREITRTWWAKTPFYRLYMLREVTAIFTLLYSINLIFALQSLIRGRESFLYWVSIQESFAMIVFAIISFLMVGYHCYTWLGATPKVMPLQIGAKKVSAGLIVFGHWVVAIILAIIILFLAQI